MLEEVKEIISTYSSTSNLAITEEFRLKIIANLSEVLDNEALFKVKGFTCVEDFYNYDISYTENINHFIETARSEEDLGAFALYTLIEKIKTLNEILFEDIFDFDGQIAYLKELDLILEIEKGFDYISEFIKEFDKTQKKTLPFLVNNKYQIFFSGYSYEDVKSLSPDNVINLISKLSNPLATEDAVPTSVGIGHVNSHYGTAYLRMHLGLHYRIAFERYHGMTIILGIAQKQANLVNIIVMMQLREKVMLFIKKLMHLSKEPNQRPQQNYKTFKNILFEIS